MTQAIDKNGLELNAAALEAAWDAYAADTGLLKTRLASAIRAYLSAIPQPQAHEAKPSPAAQPVVEIWDDATNAVCQAMQERDMCKCLDGKCLAATIQPSAKDIARYASPPRTEEGGSRDQGLEEVAAHVVRAYDANSGAEPSVSVLDRAVDELRAALKERAK